MNLQDTKALAEKFRAYAADPTPLIKLAEDTIAANPEDVDLVDLCNRFKTATPDEVRKIADEVQSKTEEKVSKVVAAGTGTAEVDKGKHKRHF